MKQEADYNKLLDLCKRAAKSKYGTMIMHKRMLMGCYDTSIDSDVGMHYILHIPDEYESLYDGQFLWNNEEFLVRNKEIKDKIEEERKLRKLPPRAVTGEVKYEQRDDNMVVEVALLLHEIVPTPPGEKKTRKPTFGETLMNIGFDMVCPIYSAEKSNPTVDNMLITFNKLQSRMCGETVLIDGLENAVLDKVQDYPRVFYYKVTLDGESIQVPLIKSFFHEIKEFDKMVFSITNTNLEDIVVYTMTYDSKGLTDQYIGYVQNFK